MSETKIEPCPMNEPKPLSERDKAAIDAAWQQFKSIPPIRHWAEDLHKLCLAIEKLPASEQQTACSVMASEILQSIQYQQTRPKQAQGENQDQLAIKWFQVFAEQPMALFHNCIRHWSEEQRMRFALHLIAEQDKDKAELIKERDDLRAKVEQAEKDINFFTACNRDAETPCTATDMHPAKYCSQCQAKHRLEYYKEITKSLHPQPETKGSEVK